MNAEQLERDVKSGNWDEVLLSISGLQLPVNKLMNLYEHIVKEMLEMKEVEVARTMVKETAVLEKMKNLLPERYQRLEDLISRSSSSLGIISESDLEALYPQGNKQIRRNDIASELLREIALVEPSRLLSLLTKSIRFSSQFEGLGAIIGENGDLSSEKGNSGSEISVNSEILSRRESRRHTVLPSSQYDLFLGRFPTEEEQDENVPRVVSTSIKFKSSSSSPESAKFSMDGSMLIVGARDGFIEVYNPHTGRLREELEYQAKEQYMAISSAVLCLNFNKTGEYMLAGGQDGTFAIFKLATGECVKEFLNVHTAPITSLSFSKDDSQILTSSLDGTIQLFGIKSGKVIRNFKSSSQSSFSSSSSSIPFIQQCHFSRDNKFIISASSDGLIRVWDNSASAQCVRSFSPGNDPISLEKSSNSSNPSNHPIPSYSSTDIHSLIPLPHLGLHQFIVSDKSPFIHLMNLHGHTLKTFTNPLPSPSPFITASISPKAHFLFAVTQDSHLLSFNLLTGEFIPPSIHIHDSEVIALHHHPFRNLLLSFATDGDLKIWKS
jgi:WD40 repeat-containing protein SMU1